MKKRRIFKLLLSILFSVSLISQVELSKINALNATLTWGEMIYYPSWLGNWSTKKCYIDGSLAYCLESSKKTPSEGTYANAVIHSNQALLKVLYYGFGGPGDVFRDDYVTNDTNKYLYTHIMASYAYSGDIYGGKSWDDLNKIGVALEGRYNQIQSMPVPTSEFSIDGSTSLTVNAYYEAGLQRTKNMVFNSDSNVTIKVPLEEGMKLHNVTKNQVYEGSGTISGGNTFYLTSDLRDRNTYSSGSIPGNNLMMYAPLVIIGSDTYQSEGTLTKTADARSLKLNVNWISGSEIVINKVDNYGENISNAAFNLLQWNKNNGNYEQLLPLTYNAVDKLYKSNFLERTEINEGKFKIEEIVPSGYTNSSRYIQEFNLDGYIDRNVFNVRMEGQEVTVKISSLLADNHTVRYEVFDVPESITAIKFPTWSFNNGQDDIQWVELRKDNDGVWRANKHMPENGDYIIHGYYNTASQINIPYFSTNIKPTNATIKVINDRIMGKISVTKTDEISCEKLSGAKFDIIAKEDIKTPQGTIINKAGDVAGSIVTNDEGFGELSDLNLGTYILREVSVPNGYHVTGDQEFTLTAKNNDIEIVKVDLNIKDRANHLKIRKIDQDTGKALAGAKFILYDVSDDSQVGQYSSDSNGEIDISKLAGSKTYYIQEIAAPKTYKLNDTKFYFEIDQFSNLNISNLNGPIEDGSFLIDQNGDMTITVKNEINLWNLRLTKKNDDNKLLADAQFALYRDEQCSHEVSRGISDSDGKLNFDNIVIGDYYLKEIKAPDGYRLLKEVIKVSLKNIDGNYTFYINDQAVSGDQDNTLTIENDLYTGNLTIVNQRGSLLPATGSSLTIVLVSAGWGLCLFGLIDKRRKGEN